MHKKHTSTFFILIIISCLGQEKAYPANRFLTCITACLKKIRLRNSKQVGASAIATHENVVSPELTTTPLPQTLVSRSNRREVPTISRSTLNNVSIDSVREEVGAGGGGGAGVASSYQVSNGENIVNTHIPEPPSYRIDRYEQLESFIKHSQHMEESEFKNYLNKIKTIAESTITTATLDQNNLYTSTMKDNAEQDLADITGAESSSESNYKNDFIVIWEKEKLSIRHQKLWEQQRIATAAAVKKLEKEQKAQTRKK